MNMSVNNLFENAAFKEKFQQAKSKNDLQKLFSEYGVELSREEIDGFVTELEKFSAGDEFDEDKLESVAGGVGVEKLVGWCWSALKGGWKLGQKFYTWEQSLYK